MATVWTSFEKEFAAEAGVQWDELSEWQKKEWSEKWMEHVLSATPHGRGVCCQGVHSHHSVASAHLTG